ncbi:hypothetical protein DFH28DRAFT_914708 [Melampsora americana]|nr:hypothetical protein DFH28DRAFT_914708 [Melampsora americana]
MSFPITISATLPITSEVSLKCQIINKCTNAITQPTGLSEGLLQWHQSMSRFLLPGDSTRIQRHVVEVIGFVTPKHALKRAQQYSICGPFSYDPNTDTTVIKYSRETQTEVCIRADTNETDVTRPIVSGLGEILSIVFAEGENESQPWNMIVTANHDYYDSLHHKFINFSIDYHFGYHTPPPVNWNTFLAVKTMWLHGIIVAKNQYLGRYVVEVSNNFLIKFQCDTD